MEEWINEYRYEGDFSGGCKTGKGKFVWSDGTVYEGDVFDGQMHGIGFLQYNDGRKVAARIIAVLRRVLPELETREWRAEMVGREGV